MSNRLEYDIKEKYGYELNEISNCKWYYKNVHLVEYKNVQSKHKVIAFSWEVNNHGQRINHAASHT